MLSWMLFERADLTLELGRWTEAESWAGKALAQALTEAALRPHPPDLYAVTLFREVRKRTALLLLEVRRSHGDAAAREAAQKLVRSLADWQVPLPAADAEPVAAAFATGEPDAVADVLLPPCPSLDDDAYMSARLEPICAGSPEQPGGARRQTW